MTEITEDLYTRAVAVVKEHQKASPSMLQRELNLGWGTASRIIDRMEREGLVGPHGSAHSFYRTVLAD